MKSAELDEDRTACRRCSKVTEPGLVARHLTIGSAKLFQLVFHLAGRAPTELRHREPVGIASGQTVAQTTRLAGGVAAYQQSAIALFGEKRYSVSSALLPRRSRETQLTNEYRVLPLGNRVSTGFMLVVRSVKARKLTQIGTGRMSSPR